MLLCYSLEWIFFFLTIKTRSYRIQVQHYNIFTQLLSLEAIPEYLIYICNPPSSNYIFYLFVLTFVSPN